MKSLYSTGKTGYNAAYRTQERSTPLRWFRWFTWLVIGIWFIFCLVTIDYNGPFFDEAIYITAGQRTLQGFGYSDGYLTWFAGSLLWPMLAGLGYGVAGLVGTRVVALLLTTVAFAAVVKAAENLFGPRAAFWTALAFALNGPLLALARLGVYDVPALTGVAVAFWAITELARRDQRVWLAVSAGAFMVGFFSKYPMGLMLLPLLGVLFFLRREKAFLDAGIFGFVALAILLAFLLPAREQIEALVSFQTTNRPTFGVTRGTILAGILYATVAPAVLAVGGWFVALFGFPQGTPSVPVASVHTPPLFGPVTPVWARRGLVTILLLNLGLWPVYHLLSGNPVGVNKHLVFSFALAYPLAGLALGALWDGVRQAASGGGSHKLRILPRLAAVAIFLLLASYAAIQLNQSDNAWPDTQPAADYLVAHVQPGEKLLINESWPYTMALYAQGRIDSPWDVYDFYRITHNEAPLQVCAYDWFVDAEGSYAWPQAVRETIQECGTYQPVFTSTSNVVALGADWNYVRYPVQTVLWQREGEQP
jgi:4-amino-4-deoxy-L-arabinose transferase-like glycosyltransferase